MTALAIEPSRAEDFSLIWPVLEPVFRAGDSYAIDRAISESEARAWWCAPSARVWTAIMDGQPVGTATLRPNQAGGGAHVCHAAFATAASARGCGVARAMAVHVMAEAKAMGFIAMQFNFVVEANRPAVHLWRSLGFDEIGRVPDGFRLPDGRFCDALILHKRL